MFYRIAVLAVCCLGMMFAQVAEKPIDHVQAALGLSAQQVTQLQQLRQARIGEIAALKTIQNTADKRAQLRALYQEEPPDYEAIGELVMAIRADEKAVNEVRVKYSQLSREVLDEDQMKKLRGLRKALKLEQAARQALSWQLIKEPRNKP